MKAVLLGARGSTPAPGPEFVRHGGATSCVALLHPGQQVPRLLLDAGTGIQRYERHFGPAPFTGTILLTHLHWDHTHGLPFFRSGDHPAAEVTLLMPAAGDPEALLARAMSPPHFPIGPRELRGQWRFQALSPGRHEIEGFEVQALEVPHKGGRTFGYRVTGPGGGVTTYIPDHAAAASGPGPDGLGEIEPETLELAREADLLIHDGQYTAPEFPARASFGHSSIEYALRLAGTANARRLVVFHHDPGRTDAELDVINARLLPSWPHAELAVEGAVLEVPLPTAPGTGRD